MFSMKDFSNEPEFQAAVEEMFSSLDDSVLSNPKYKEVIERIVTPDKIITFDVEWFDDSGTKHISIHILSLKYLKNTIL